MALHGVLQAGEQDTSRVEAGNTGAVVGKLRPADRAGITEVQKPLLPVNDQIEAGADQVG